MRKITGKVTTFVFAVALAAFASACTNSPFGPSQDDDEEEESGVCYTVNGHIVCIGDR
jgi:hypothetical protein